MSRSLTLAATLAVAATAAADAATVPDAAGGAAPAFVFASIDGGTLNTADWRGRPVLVVNTASLCGFTPQLEGLQKLHDTYGPRGLVVLAVPSDSFRQEYETGKQVAEFCTVQYGITLPMADITPVKGLQAHPFYAWMRDAHGFEPSWNFNKVLLDGAGRVVATWGARTQPLSPQIVEAFTPLLDR